MLNYLETFQWTFYNGLVFYSCWDLLWRLVTKVEYFYIHCSTVLSVKWFVVIIPHATPRNKLQRVYLKYYRSSVRQSFIATPLKPGLNRSSWDFVVMKINSVNSNVCWNLWFNFVLGVMPLINLEIRQKLEIRNWKCLSAKFLWHRPTEFHSTK